MSLLRSLLTPLLAILLLTGCLRSPAAAPQQPTLITKGSGGALEFDATRGFLAGVDRLNTYERFVGAKSVGLTTRTLVLMTPGPEPVWRARDSRGNWVEFLLEKETGLAITRAHNTEYKSWMLPEAPLVFARTRMPQGVRTEMTQPFTTWADGWTTRTGTITLGTWFAGVEDTTTTLGEVIPGCARIDSDFDVSINFLVPFRALVRQRQWVHPRFGEVRREVEAEWGAVGVALSRFRTAQVLTRSEVRTAEELARIFDQFERTRPEERRRRRSRLASS